ncbi:hypothetical protein ACODT5_03710 [Streptomyces sp. 5.8]|uniref:hypothetical protein n=1 Tax=Streptomyces sp. 5.8 TaxID=3406571 RepID=UPI003BB74064
MARNLARVPRANVLFGVLLHAADRLRQGERLTELEELLLGTLEGVLPKEEVLEWGRVYRESVTARKVLVGVPEVVTSRPVSQGYGYADLEQDLPAVAEEWMAQPNWSVATPEALASGEDFDSPEFIEGMREWGFGVTVPAWLTASGEERAGRELPEGERAAEYRFRLEYENFYVHRVVGDGWPTTRDEIRWLSGGQSDLRPAVPFLSQEFGGETAQAGRTPAFYTSYRDRVAFDGAADKGLVLNVACWEWDTGDGQDDSFREAMNKLNQNALFTHLWTVIGAAVPDIIGLLMDITATAITIVNLVAKNDLSSSRTFYLDQPTLAAMAYNGTTRWHFNGDGHHELRVKVTGDIPMPVGTLEYAVRTGNTWGTPAELPWQSITPPALASYNNKLYALFVRPDDKAVMWTRLEGDTWKTPAQVGGDASVFAPALAVKDGKLFYAVSGAGARLYWRTFTEATGWSDITHLAGNQSTKSPALAATTYRVWMTHVGFDGSLWHNWYENGAWSVPQRSNLNSWVVDDGVAMARHGDHLWRVARGHGNYVYTSTGDGHGWQDRGTVTRWSVTHAPALASHESALWIFLRAMDGSLRAATRRSPDYAWSDTHQVGGQHPITTMDEPSAVSHDGKLYVMYRR